MKISTNQLGSIAEMVNGRFIVNGDPTSSDPDDLPFLAVIAGAGEIQLDTDGNAWYFQWDRTHAVSVEKELTPPDTDDIDVLAHWLTNTAGEFDLTDI